MLSDYYEIIRDVDSKFDFRLKCRIPAKVDRIVVEDNVK